MTPIAIATFIIIAGLVWGGFIVIATIAVRKEGAKSRADDAS
ncbi:MAG: hypothetical protein ACRELD_07745 [Longimicrobiales bacterium]